MTRRLRHYIKGNANTELPAQAIWFDTESHQLRRCDGSILHVLWFGWACYQRTRGDGHWCAPVWHRFTSAEGFWIWVISMLRPRTRTYTFCHNTNFDLPVVKAFDIPKTLGGELTRAIIDAPPTIVHWRFGNATCVMLDTLNFWRVPLDALGESIGAPKLYMPPPEADQDEWDFYCRNDVEVIRQACLRWWGFLGEYDLGGFAPTLAGQSLRSWRHRFMSEKVLIDDDERALALARAAYLGGRNECFRHGVIQGPIAYIDINSMYPAVMAEGTFPTVLVGYDATRPEFVYRKYSPTHACVGKVLLECEEGIYPRVINNRLCFPTGRFWASLAGPELGYADRHGHIVAWESVAVYRQAPLFKEFVEFFYNERLKAKAAGNEVLAFFLKILMNSLYGKFGQRGMVWEETKHTDDMTSKAWLELDADTGVLYRCRQLAGLIQVKSDEGEARESHPAIAAFVTSYARLKLWYLMLDCGRENVLYVDTDGAFVTQAGLARITDKLDPGLLGAPKLEGVHRYVHIRGLKDYDLGGQGKVKGVKKSARWLTDGEIRQDQWSGLTGQLGRSDLGASVTRSIVKHLSREYHKGTLEPDGRVTPLKLVEG